MDFLEFLFITGLAFEEEEKKEKNLKKLYKELNLETPEEFLFEEKYNEENEL